MRACEIFYGGHDLLIYVCYHELKHIGLESGLPVSVYTSAREFKIQPPTHIIVQLTESGLLDCLRIEIGVRLSHQFGFNKIQAGFAGDKDKHVS